MFFVVFICMNFCMNLHIVLSVFIEAVHFPKLLQGMGMGGPNGQMGGPMGGPMGPMGPPGNMMQGYQGWGTPPQTTGYPGL
jgi:hypothetical protein